MSAQSMASPLSIPRPTTEVLRLLAQYTTEEPEDLNIAPEELAGIRPEQLQRALVWATPAWAMVRGVCINDRLTLMQSRDGGITVEVMRAFSTDRSPSGNTIAYAYLGVLEQEIRSAHRYLDSGIETAMQVARWSRQSYEVAHSWQLTVYTGDALDAYLTALHLDACAHIRAAIAVDAPAVAEVLTPNYHRWQARLADGEWGPSESLFLAVTRYHGDDTPETWQELRRLSRVALSTRRVRPLPQ